MEQAQTCKKSEIVESGRETAKIARRAADRLVVADQRHQAAKDHLDAEKEHQHNLLQRETQRAEHDLSRCETATQNHVANATMLRYERESQAEHHLTARDASIRHVDIIRNHRDQHSARIDAETCRTSEAAEGQIGSSRSSTRAKLDSLTQQRSEIEARSSRTIEARECQTQVAIESLQQRSAAEVLGSEAYRHRAAMSVDRFGELLQAARSVATAKTKLNETHAAEQSADLTRMRHQVQKHADAAITDKLRASAMEIDAAHRHCSLVSAGKANDAALCARRADQVAQDADARSRDAERQVFAVETARVGNFVDGRCAVKETQERLQAGRDTCGIELESIHQRLRELEEETRAKAAEIMRQWDEGNEATEQAVQNHEQRGRDALHGLRSAIESVREEARGRNSALQHEGAVAVAHLERRANRAVDATQPTLESARRADEDATAATLARLRELRPEPVQLEAEADARISGLTAQAAKDEEELQRAADAKIAKAKGIVATARTEEQRLITETAGAWQRLRKACYQLRLMNLHDFAEGIVAGSFDTPLPLLQQHC